MSNSNLRRKFALYAGTILLAACEQAPVETPEVVRPVRILTIAGLEAGGVLRYPGEIQGVQNAELAFEVPGRLVELPIQEGIKVTEGMLLAQLDQTEFQASLDAAEARFRSSSETFERFSEVFERGAISRQELDNRRRQFEVERAQLDSARKAFDDTELRAPFSGRVGRTYVDNFNNVQAKQPILLLQDLAELDVVVNVPEQDWLRARPGLTLAQQSERAQPEVSLSTVPGRTFPATITEVAAAADPVTRTFEARARFDPPEDLQILPGMSATVTINIPSNYQQGDLSILLPVSAVVGGNDGGSFVWTVDSESMTVSRRTVTVGRLSGSEIEIVEGLSIDDRVAVSGVQHLTDDMRVRELQN
jgi:RND family efflux transporter MFP subunit